MPKVDILLSSKSLYDKISIQSFFCIVHQGYKGTKLLSKGCTTLNRISQINLFLASSPGLSFDQTFRDRNQNRSILSNFSFRKIATSGFVRSISLADLRFRDPEQFHFDDGSSLLYRRQRSISCLQLNEMRLMCRRKKVAPRWAYHYLSIVACSSRLVTNTFVTTQTHTDFGIKIYGASFCFRRERAEKEIEKRPVFEINIYCWLHGEAIGPKAIAAVIKTNSHFFPCFSVETIHYKRHGFISVCLRYGERKCDENWKRFTSRVHAAPPSNDPFSCGSCVWMCWRRLKIESSWNNRFHCAVSWKLSNVHVCFEHVSRRRAEQTKGISSRRGKRECHQSPSSLSSRGCAPVQRCHHTRCEHKQSANTANNGEKAWERNASSNQNWKEWKRRKKNTQNKNERWKKRNKISNGNDMKSYTKSTRSTRQRYRHIIIKDCFCFAMRTISSDDPLFVRILHSHVIHHACVLVSNETECVDGSARLRAPSAAEFNFSFEFSLWEHTMAAAYGVVCFSFFHSVFAHKRTQRALCDT